MQNISVRGVRKFLGASLAPHAYSVGYRFKETKFDELDRRQWNFMSGDVVGDSSCRLGLVRRDMHT